MTRMAPTELCPRAVLRLPSSSRGGALTNACELSSKNTSTSAAVAGTPPAVSPLMTRTVMFIHMRSFDTMHSDLSASRNRYLRLTARLRNCASTRSTVALPRLSTSSAGLAMRRRHGHMLSSGKFVTVPSTQFCISLARFCR